MPVAQPQDQFREQQGQLAQSLFGTLSGQTPSVAEQQLRQSTDRNIANAYAMAQSGRYNPAASRQAAMNAGLANQQGAGQAAMLRAQEIANTQGMLGSLLGGARGQDISNFATQNQVAQGYLGQNLDAARAQMGGQMQREQQALANFQNAQQNALGGRLMNAAASVFGGMSGAGAFGSRGGGAMTQFSSGGVVPGYAYGGDHPVNDVIAAMLSPGEIVLPRSVTKSKNPGHKAKMFVDAIKQMGPIGPFMPQRSRGVA
jgi:hypothetical protein